ncbi:cell adhesion molecule Dscam2-like [Anticarsia gemmatalis]|uniref:cell adhesion molecule Dscam2-like n=1 Tax=Anticarsia gemmatalis TaxID=129554 RepID=UPI003F76180F
MRAPPPLPPPPLLALLGALLAAQVWCEVSMLGPSLVVEPAARVQFSAAAGVRVRCAARGHPPPALTWLADDNTPLHDAPALRRIHSNGTLEILPAPGGYEAAAMTVRCRAANPHGVALSRDVTLQPVVDGGWEAEASAPAAALGGVAAVTCGATRHAALVQPALWYRADTVLHVDPPTPKSRYVVAGNTLLIRDVAASDAGPYSCLARHSLTATTKRARPAHLTVTPSSANSAPRLVSAGGELSVSAGHDVCLPCVATDLKQPHYTWYRELNGRLQPVEAEGASGWAWAGGAAQCLRRVTPAAAGLWICKAYNVYGDATAHVTLAVRDALSVSVAPGVLVADTGSTARFTCSASDAGAALSWLHDGAPAGSGADLVLRGVARAHRGVYQCVARRAADSAQAAAELRLGDSAPELHYTFIEQALRAGGSVSLRCAASGSPPPRFTWLLDDQPLDQYRAQHRYFISSETSVTGDVVSVLNMSAVTAADGGRYTCRAHNDRGHAHHSARLNIYGPPSIRALGPVRVVAGANATIYCPYAGYPISSISWWRRGASVAVGGAGRVAARGAELRLAPALPADAGHYACAVAAPQGPAARRDIDIQVRNPPKISPFIFSSELTEGSSVQVLCGVSSGDKPMYFSWLKDGAPLPSNLQIEEKSLNEFSLLMFSDLSARHSGAYTCRVSNHAATVNYTASLSVKVAPAWATEPLDAAVLLGAPLLVQCAAKGYPAPTITWYRRIGEGGEGVEQWEQVGAAEWGAAEGAVHARNGSLSAPGAARTHQGLYRCVADNGVGPPLVKHINVTVHEPAHFEGTGGNVSCVRGRSAALVCHALGDAPLVVHWTHRGIRLDLTSYRWAVTEVRTGAGLRSTLQLRAAERADIGEYRCHAHNQYGRSEQLMYLHVDEPPEAPRRLVLGGVGSRWVRLAWASPPASPPLAHAYTALYTTLHALPGAEARQNTVNLTVDTTADDSLDTDGLRTLSARLDGLRPAAAYSLRLTAANHVGQSPQSEPLLFTTLEEAPTASPQNVRVRAANAGELHVSWSAPPQDSWNGELLGYVVTWRELSRFDEEDADDAPSSRRAGSATAAGWSSAELTVGGLRSFARYALTVRAYNRAGAGPHSPAVYATTADGVPEQAPRAVTCEAVSPRALRVRWAPLSAQHAHALRGYDLHYAPIYFASSWSGAGESQTARAGVSGEATLQGLRAATNYSVWVRARADAGLGPPSPPVYCATTEDVPEAVSQIRALACGADAVRVTWLAPAAAPRLTHYTLYTRELGKVGGEWAQRVDASGAEGAAGEALGGGEEVWREVRGLRERTVYEFWVRAATSAGAGPPSRPVTAAPAPPVSARVSSFSRVVYAAWGARVRLRCAAVGAPPLRWRWAPLPSAHTITDTGDLIIHRAEASSGGNYTCEVRNGGGSDALAVSLAVRLPPAAPALRLVRADVTALLLAWDAPSDGGAAILGYTLQWARGDSPAADRERRVPPADAAHALTGLACGATYRITLRAHNVVGASPHSRPLLARTRGDKARAPPGKALVWANSTALRLNLLAWGGRCPVTAWSVAVRAAAAGSWRDLHTNGETAEAGNLRPGSWYEIRVVARSPAGDTLALYRAATHTLNGERLGEAVEVPAEAHGVSSEGSGAAGTGSPAALWRAGLAPALLGGGLALLLAILAGVVLARRRHAATCLHRECSLQQVCQPHPQLYTTEPSKRNGKTMTPPDVPGELHEISPYATFSMSGGAESCGGGGAGGAGCALHLRTFGRAEALDLAAPPPRPNLLAHTNEYGRGRDSDSESSGSPCAACAAELYRLPAAHLSDTLPAVESSADDASYAAGARGARGARPPPRARRRRDHARHHSQPTVSHRF